MKENEKIGEAQYWDAAAECASATAYTVGTVFGAMSLQPWAAAGLGFNAITSSTACIAKIASIASGQTVGQYSELSGAMALLDPWGLLLAAGTGGETLKNSAPSNVFSAGQSQTELFYEVLSKPRRLSKTDFFQIAGDLIKYASSASDGSLRQERLLGVSLRDKTDENPILLYEVPKGKKNE